MTQNPIPHHGGHQNADREKLPAENHVFLRVRRA